MQDAVLVAGRILNALDYVGVVGVELFVTPSGLVVNEIAPRVHNSGHWTEAGCLVDQFEQHVRAICGWPLGDGARHSDAEMVNLIGDDVLQAPAIRGARVHLYGKAEARPGRKMGHYTRIAPRTPRGAARGSRCAPCWCRAAGCCWSTPIRARRATSGCRRAAAPRPGPACTTTWCVRCSRRPG